MSFVVLCVDVQFPQHHFEKTIHCPGIVFIQKHSPLSFSHCPLGCFWIGTTFTPGTHSLVTKALTVDAPGNCFSFRGCHLCLVTDDRDGDLNSLYLVQCLFVCHMYGLYCFEVCSVYPYFLQNIFS